MSTFAEYLPAISPPWLRGPWGEGWQQKHGVLIDRLEQGFRDAIKTRLVGACPLDALSYHGRERLLEQFPNETLSAYQTRLLAAWVSLHFLGTAYGIEQALIALGFAGAKVYGTGDAAPTWWSGSWPPAPRAPKPSWWVGAWPVANGDTQWWSRFWVVLTAPGPFGWTAAPAWGAFNWGTSASPLWGIGNATTAQIQLVRRIVERWRPAHEICDGIFVHFGTSQALLRGTDR